MRLAEYRKIGGTLYQVVADAGAVNAVVRLVREDVL